MWLRPEPGIRLDQPEDSNFGLKHDPLPKAREGPNPAGFGDVVLFSSRTWMGSDLEILRLASAVSRTRMVLSEAFLGARMHYGHPAPGLKR